MHPITAIFFVLGSLTLIGAILDMKWLMESKQGQFWAGLFTRRGARIFYALAGLAMILLGILSMTQKTG